MNRLILMERSSLLLVFKRIRKVYDVLMQDYKRNIHNLIQLCVLKKATRKYCNLLFSDATSVGSHRLTKRQEIFENLLQEFNDNYYTYF
jgi:hypothetical protein